MRQRSQALAEVTPIITPPWPSLPGTRLGPSEVVSAIDAGGMGEVYRATDTKLKRQVAIKILPSYIAADQRLTAVRVTLGANGKLGLGTPIPLFRTELTAAS